MFYDFRTGNFGLGLGGPGWERPTISKNRTSEVAKMRMSRKAFYISTEITPDTVSCPLSALPEPNLFSAFSVVLVLRGASLSATGACFFLFHFFCYTWKQLQLETTAKHL